MVRLSNPVQRFLPIRGCYLERILMRWLNIVRTVGAYCATPPPWMPITCSTTTVFVKTIRSRAGQVASEVSSFPRRNSTQDVVHRSPDCVATTVPASVCISNLTGMRLRNCTVPSLPLASYTKVVEVFRILA